MKVPSCPSRPTVMLGLVEGGGGRGGGGGGGRTVGVGVAPGRHPYRATPSRERAREKSIGLRGGVSGEIGDVGESGETSYISLMVS